MVLRRWGVVRDYLVLSSELMMENVSEAHALALCYFYYISVQSIIEQTSL